MFPFPNRDASVHRDWPADVRYVAAEDGARIAEKGELGVAFGNDRPLAFIRVQILVKTTVNDKRQKARIPAMLQSFYALLSARWSASNFGASYMAHINK